MTRRRSTETEVALGKRQRLVASAGFALFMLCCMLTIWGGLPLLERTGLSFLSLLVWCSIPLLTTIAASLFVLAYTYLFPVSLATCIDVLSRPLSACLLIIGGYGVLVFVGKFSGETAAGVFGILAGMGIASLLMRWEMAFNTLERDDVVKVVLVALIVHSILFAALALAPQLVLELVFTASTLGSTALLCVFERREHPVLPMSVQDDAFCTKRRTSLFKALRNPIFCVAATVFAVAITRTMALQTAPQMIAAVGMASSIGAAVAGAILSLVLVISHRLSGRALKPNITSLYRVMFPLIATALLLLSIFNGTELVVTMFMYAAFSLLFVLIMPSCLEVSHPKRDDVKFSFGVFSGIVYTAFAAGALTSVVLYHARIFDAPIPLIAALLVLYALSMAYAGMQRREKPRQDHKPDELSKAGLLADDSFEKRCEMIAHQFELSPRETEVLVAFARGRNVVYLANQLCLSENTIRSHSKSLYTKLGIHSKQELLDLVEGTSDTQ